MTKPNAHGVHRGSDAGDAASTQAGRGPARQVCTWLPMAQPAWQTHAQEDMAGDRGEGQGCCGHVNPVDQPGKFQQLVTPGLLAAPLSHQSTASITRSSMGIALLTMVTKVLGGWREQDQACHMPNAANVSASHSSSLAGCRQRWMCLMMVQGRHLHAGHCGRAPCQGAGRRPGSQAARAQTSCCSRVAVSGSSERDTVGWEMGDV
jgi:hypothetical protein